jgi:hypothetical protein
MRFKPSAVFGPVGRPTMKPATSTFLCSRMLARCSSGLYAGVGYAPRVISGMSHFDEVSILSLNPPLATHSEFFLPGSWDTTHGVVVEGGIEKRAGRLRIALELRYIHWNQLALNVQQPHGLLIVSTQNQGDVLVGITFLGATR